MRCVLLFSGLLLLSTPLLAWNRRWWWWRDADPEQLFGLAVLVAVLGSVSIVLWTICWDGSPKCRALIALVTVVAAGLAASTNWTRRSLRRFGFLAVLLLGVLVIDIGRDDGGAQAAVRELTAAKNGLKVLEEPAALRQKMLEDAATKTRDALLGKADAVRPEYPKLAEAADAIHIQLESNRGALKGMVDRMAFDARYRAGGASDAEIALRTAVDAAIQADTAAKEAPALAGGIAAACATARRVHPHVTVPDGFPCLASADEHFPLPVALAWARLDVAKYTKLVLDRPIDEANVKTLEKALEDAQGASTSAPADQGIGNSLATGANVVVADVFGSADPPVVAETLAWSVLLIALLGVWRVVERRSGQQLAGPVTPELTGAKPPPKPEKTEKAQDGEPPNGKKGDSATPAAENGDETQQKAVFREALLQNLPEPATVPGAQAPSPVTDLAELGATGLFGKAVAAVVAIISKPGGYLVKGDVVAPSTTDGIWRVLVRVHDQTTNDQLAVKIVSGPTSTAACRVAGYWAAATILSRSTRIPSWASWKTETAEALTQYQDADHLAVEELEKAVASAPTSGLLLNKLANQYDLNGRHREALVLYTRAVASHPRYQVARYRMALSVGIMHYDADKQWSPASLSEKRRIADQLERACKRLEIPTTDLAGHTLAGLPGLDVTQATELFEALTEDLLDRLHLDGRWPRVLSRTLRRSERVVWWPRARTLLRRYGTAGQARWLVRSARLLYGGTDGSKVEDRARHAQSGWQLHYNLACRHARNAESEQALRFLEAALERPGCEQMGAGWLTKDPDLKSLHGLPRFEWVKEQLDRGEQKGSVSA